MKIKCHFLRPKKMKLLFLRAWQMRLCLIKQSCNFISSSFIDLHNYYLLINLDDYLQSPRII